MVVPEPDLDRLDRMVEGELAGRGRPQVRGPRSAATSPPVAADAAKAQPEWSRTLLGLLERLLERLDRIEHEVQELGRRVDGGGAAASDDLARLLSAVQRSEDAAAVLSGQVSGLDAQVRELRSEIARLLGDSAA